MKKILFILFLMSLNFAFGVRWVEIGYKQYLDYDSIELRGFVVTAWFKDLNPGNWDLYNGKKIYYMLQKVDIDCKNKKIGLKNVVYYDLKNKVLYSPISELSNWSSVVPDSVGEYKYQFMCKPFVDNGLI